VTEMTFSFLRQKRGEGPKAAFPPDSTILSQIVDVAISRPSDFRLSRLVVGSSFFLFFFLFSFFFAHHATRNVRSGSVRRGRKRATIPPVSHLKDRDPTKISARTGRIWENLPRTKPLTGERDMETWRMRAREREREREKSSTSRCNELQGRVVAFCRGRAGLFKNMRKFVSDYTETRGTKEER